MNDEHRHGRRAAPRRIDLNADVGEGADEEALFDLVSSVNVACGGHAGTHATMTEAVRVARRLGLAIGAHPGYRDPEHFGRRPLALAAEEVRAQLLEQLAALARVAEFEGATLVHVKPHGALYNQAAVDSELAGTIVDAVRTFDPSLAVIGLARSELPRAARAAGVLAFDEGFADRRYCPDGTLAPRGTEGAVIVDAAESAAQAVAIARGDPVRAVDGTEIRIQAHTICLHADTPGALARARAVHAALTAEDVRIGPVLESRP